MGNTTTLVFYQNLGVRNSTIKNDLWELISSKLSMKFSNDGDRVIGFEMDDNTSEGNIQDIHSFLALDGQSQYQKQKMLEAHHKLYQRIVCQRDSSSKIDSWGILKVISECIQMMQNNICQIHLVLVSNLRQNIGDYRYLHCDSLNNLHAAKNAAIYDFDGINEIYTLSELTKFSAISAEAIIPSYQFHAPVVAYWTTLMGLYGINLKIYQI